jgi:hypothetical protein
MTKNQNQNYKEKKVRKTKSREHTQEKEIWHTPNDGKGCR